MEVKNNNEFVVDTEIVEETGSTTNQTYLQIKEKFTNLQKQDTSATDDINSSASLKSLDELNNLLVEGFQFVEEMANKNKEKDIVGKSVSGISKFLPSWINTKIANKAQEIKKDKLQEKPVNEVINGIISNIDLKRNELITIIEKIEKLREYTAININQYKQLSIELVQLLETKLPTRETFDARKLLINVNTTLVTMNQDLENYNNMITATELTLTDYDTEIVKLEYELKTLSAGKITQQNLSDYINSIKAVSELTSKFRQVLQNDVNVSIKESMQLVSSSNVNVDEIIRLSKQQDGHKKELITLVQNNFTKLGTDLDKLQKEQIRIESESYENILLSNNSKKISIGVINEN